MVSVLGASRPSLPRWCDFVIRDVCVLGLTEYHTVCDLKLCLLQRAVHLIHSQIIDHDDDDVKIM